MHMNLQTYRYTDAGAYIITYKYIYIYYMILHVCVCIHTHTCKNFSGFCNFKSCNYTWIMFESTSRSAWELERPLWNWRIATWFSRVQASPSTLPLFTWLWEASCRQIMVDPGTKFQSVSYFVPSAFSVVLLRLSLLHLFFSTTPRCKLWTGWETQDHKLSLWTSLWQMGSHVFFPCFKFEHVVRTQESWRHYSPGLYAVNRCVCAYIYIWISQKSLWYFLP